MKGKIRLWLDKNLLYRRIMRFVSKFIYSYYLKNYDINDRAVFLESQQGKRINGNIFYILRELSTNESYKKYNIYICCNEDNEEKFKKVFDAYGFGKVEFVSFGTADYMKKLATSKYLFNDNVFDPFFTKKEGQVYINTWHGVPLSAIGKSLQNGIYNAGNIQKNLVSADYVICPNVYTKQKLEEEFMIENIATGKVLLSDYPKTAALYDEQRSAEIRQELELENKRIYAYIPVRRGKDGQVEDKNDVFLLYYLYELDKLLTDDEILYVKLNAAVAKNINFRECTHIRRFPGQYEPYDFLSCVDCLVTDYSNVIFDYASTNKKCVLFSFDEDVYFETHKTYLSIDEFPFCRVKNIQDLINELRSPKNYDDNEFTMKYCSYKNANATEDILNYVISEKETNKLKEVAFNKNEKNNVIVYIEDKGNAIKSAVENFFENADFSKNNYYLAFHMDNGKKYKNLITELPDEVKCFSFAGSMNLGLCKKIIWKIFIKGLFPVLLFVKIFKFDLECEIRRLFGESHFDSVIHLKGAGIKMLVVLSEFNCEKIIYASNDAAYSNKQFKKVLKYIRSRYDKIV